METTIPKKVKVGYLDSTPNFKHARLTYWTGKRWYREDRFNKEILKDGDEVQVLNDDNPDNRHWEWKPAKDVRPIEIDNRLMDGFKLSKRRNATRLIGQRTLSVGNNYFITDPRGFDVQISLDNLKYILAHCDIRNGVIQDEMCYGWQEQHLVLIPESAETYKEAMEFTRFNSQKVTFKDLTIGDVCLMKNKHKYVYLGRHEAYGYNNMGSDMPLGRKLWFYDTTGKRFFNFGIPFIKEKVDFDFDYQSYLDELQELKSYKTRKLVVTHINLETLELAVAREKSKSVYSPCVTEYCVQKTRVRFHCVRIYVMTNGTYNVRISPNGYTRYADQTFVYNTLEEVMQNHDLVTVESVSIEDEE